MWTNTAPSSPYSKIIFIFPFTLKIITASLENLRNKQSITDTCTSRARGEINTSIKSNQCVCIDLFRDDKLS
jgi:hypothetical protein